MSIYSKDTKKKTKTTKPKKKEPDVELEFSPEGAAALQDGDIQEAVQQGINPMAIPDLFNNIRNNYYVGNRIIG